MKECALKFTHLSVYFDQWQTPGPCITKFVSGVSKIVGKQCRTTILIKDMEFSHLMTHDQQIEQEELKESSKLTRRDLKDRVDYFNKNITMYQLISVLSKIFVGNHIFCQCSISNFNKDRALVSNSQGKVSTGRYFPTCQKNCKNNPGERMNDIGGCFLYGKSFYKLRHFPLSKGKGRDFHQLVEPNACVCHPTQQGTLFNTHGGQIQNMFCDFYA